MKDWFDKELHDAAAKTLEYFTGKKLRLATAESCTGGLVATALTEIPGCSHVFDRGYITYSNAAKQQELGVPADTLREFGAVSEETARAMAEGALKNSKADYTVSITGIAGPDGGSDDKPVGLVHIAAARKDKVLHEELRLGNLGRGEVRRRSALAAFALLEKLAKS
jgi:nicotinamide-nucleotide amidase